MTAACWLEGCWLRTTVGDNNSSGQRRSKVQDAAGGKGQTTVRYAKNVPFCKKIH